MPTFTFQCVCNVTQPGDEVFLVGSDVNLGNWDHKKGIKMHTAPQIWPKWRSDHLKIPPSKVQRNKPLQYKYIIKSHTGSTKWEPFPENRQLILLENHPEPQDDAYYTVYNHWGANTYDPPVIKPKKHTPTTTNPIPNEHSNASTKATIISNSAPAPTAPLTLPDSSFSSPNVHTQNHQQPQFIPFRKSQKVFDRTQFIPSKLTPITDDYDIYEKIGEGTWGSVMRVRDKRTGAIRAAKKTPKSFVDDIDRFRAEVEVLKKLDHPNIVKIFRAYEDDNNIYLILELCKGGELFDRLVNSGSFPETAACTVMHQILSALAYCHAAGIVHRDVKPENFLYADHKPDSMLKVIDFGLAAIYDPEPEGTLMLQQEKLAREKNKMMLHTRVGTPLYVAPELLDGNYNPQADVWSCGVMLYLLLVGYPPFNGRNDALIMHAVRRGRLVFPMQDWARISPQAKNLTTLMLKRDPTMRPTALEALQHPWFKALNHSALLIKTTTLMTTTTTTTAAEAAVARRADSYLASSSDSTYYDHALHGHDTGFFASSPCAEKGPVAVPVDLIDKFRRFRSLSRLKRLMLTVLAQQSADDELEELRQLFTAVDKENKGIVTLDDIQKYLGSIGKQMPVDLPALLQEVNQSGTGVIEYTEFLAACLQRKHYAQEAACRAAFTVLDGDGDGKILREDLLDILLSGGIFSEGEIEEELDHDMLKADVLDFDNFFTLIRAVPSSAGLVSSASRNLMGNLDDVEGVDSGAAVVGTDLGGTMKRGGSRGLLMAARAASESDFFTKRRNCNSINDREVGEAVGVLEKEEAEVLGMVEKEEEVVDGGGSNLLGFFSKDSGEDAILPPLFLAQQRAEEEARWRNRKL